MRKAPAQQVGVGLVDLIEEGHHDAVVPAFLLAALDQLAVLVDADFAGLEQFRAKHRDEGDGHQRRGRNHDGHDPAQLLEEDAGQAGEHRQRDEHGRDDKRRRDDGGPHLVGGVDGRLVRRGAAVDMLGNVLQHHDGVVHHHTDGHRQGGQRNDVERTVGEHQVDEGHNQGNRDGDADDQRSAPLAQEEEHDQHHEEEGVQDGFFQGTDGVLDLFRRVVNHLDLNVGRERLLDAGEFLAHVFTDLHGVGARLLGHHQADGFLAVHFLVEREVLDGIAHGSQVTHEDFLPQRRGGDHDVGDVGALLVLAAHLHLILLAVHLDRTARQVQVVHAHGVGHLFERQVVGVELGLVDVDIDIAVRGA